ncbi:MAG: nucleotidyltransferase [Clostridia bacterium]|nr:nucleotidyltransferase [Clostridia bacterium]
MEPVLVIMAAGMGSRYGGLKQIDPVDAAGNLIIDFSVFDAMRAGFEEVIFIIKKELEADFHAVIGDRLSSRMRVRYAFQRLDALPQGVRIPEGRQKPWGTTHAILCAAEEIGSRPFCAINADDYYGPAAYRAVYDYLKGDRPAEENILIAWRLANTLTEHGSVARGVCRVQDGYLKHIEERKTIIRQGDGGAFTEDGGKTYTFLPGDTPVSMNFWGFGPEMLPALDKIFKENLLSGAVEANPLKYEDLLPNAVQTAIGRNQAKVRVHTTPDCWFGVTYKEDKPQVMASIATCKEQGLYSEKLW